MLLGIEVVAELHMVVDSERRYSKIWKVEWKAMVRNNKNRRVFSLVPAERGRAKLEEYFAKIKKRSVEVVAIQADSESGFEVRKVGKPKHERARGKISKIENSVGGVKEMFTNFISRAINIARKSPTRTRIGNWRFVRNRKSYNNEEYITELKDRIEISKGIVSVSGFDKKWP